MDTGIASEVMTSTAELAKRLGVGPAMVRKWAIAYEDATGDRVRLKSKRDGREFSPSQVAVIVQAKEYVDQEKVKVETGLKMALGQTEAVPVVPLADSEGKAAIQLLEAILEKHDETNRLLLEEIRGLRQDLQARELPAVPSSIEDSSSKSEEKSYTLLQLWVKRLFGV